MSAVFYALTACFFAAREADRLWTLQTAVEASQLQRGFSGRLEDAQSSVDSDRQNILGEIRARQQEAAVEHAITVLIAAGMSTPDLRAAASHGVDISGAGWWCWAQIVVVGIVFVAHPLCHAIGGMSCDGLWGFVPWLKAAEGLLWFALFVRVGVDQRGFVAAVAVKIGAVPYYLGWAGWIAILMAIGRLHPRASCAPDMVGAFLWGPLMLSASLLGVGGCASVCTSATNLVLHGRCPATRKGSDESAEGASDDSLESG